MIRVLAIYQKGKLVSFEVKGHAGSGEEGHDLVCAAISGIVPGAFNAFLQEYDIEVLSGYIKLVAPSNGLQAHDEIVMVCVMAQISAIAESYPRYVKLTRKE